MSAPRLRRLATFWSLAAVVLVIWRAFSEMRLGLTDGVSHPVGEDFINFWSGAALAAQGHARLAYDLQKCHDFQVSVVGHAIQMYHYSYPPTMMLLTAPLGVLPYGMALIAWSLLGLTAFGRAAYLAWPGRDALLFAMAAPGTVVNLMDGQTGLWTAAILGGGMLCLDRRPLLAGGLLGLLICKPQIGFLIPLALLSGRRWSALFAMAAIAAALLGASIFCFGVDLWKDYAQLAQFLRRFDLESGESWEYMPSLFMMLRRWGVDVASCYLAQAALAAGVGGSRRDRGAGLAGRDVTGREVVCLDPGADVGHAVCPQL